MISTNPMSQQTENAPNSDSGIVISKPFFNSDNHSESDQKINSNESNSFSIEDLSDAYRGRYYFLGSRYHPPMVIEILSQISQYGVNTWSNTCSKFIPISREANLELKNSLYDEIELGREYNKVWLIEEIINIVSANFAASIYRHNSSNIVKLCVADFLQWHMADTVYSDKVNEKTGKRIIIGYRPTIDLTDQKF
jgi:hypothetical protein